jgi:hypothetical protein
MLILDINDQNVTYVFVSEGTHVAYLEFKSSITTSMYLSNSESALRE